MSYKILIVDDSKLAQMAIDKILNMGNQDWIRVEAVSAEDALTSISQVAPDVALIDYQMPGRDGLDLAAELRMLQPEMPLAVISANHQEILLDRARAIGASFLPNPLTEQALSEFLNDAARVIQKSAS